MLELVVKTGELFNESTEEFVYPTQTVRLEHSLVSLSKWESRFEKPLLTTAERSLEETLYLLQAMCLTPDLPPEIFHKLSEENITEINEYMTAKMTATWFTEPKNTRPNREVVTAELIYYWMISLQIPMECQHWHLNRLLTLIRVVSLKNTPKKMSRAEAARQQRELNEQRLRQHNTRG